MAPGMMADVSLPTLVAITSKLKWKRFKAGTTYMKPNLFDSHVRHATAPQPGNVKCPWGEGSPPEANAMIELLCKRLGIKANVHGECRTLYGFGSHGTSVHMVRGAHTLLSRSLSLSSLVAYWCRRQRVQLRLQDGYSDFARGLAVHVFALYGDMWRPVDDRTGAIMTWTDSDGKTYDEELLHGDGPRVALLCSEDP